MAHVRIEVEGRTIFDDIIHGYHPPPDVPAKPESIDIKAMPAWLREPLDKAMSAMLFKATGRHWTPTD